MAWQGGGWTQESPRQLQRHRPRGPDHLNSGPVGEPAAGRVWLLWKTRSEKMKPFPSDWGLNPAQTHGLPTESTHLVSRLDEAQVPGVSSQKEFCGRQSGR